LAASDIKPNDYNIAGLGSSRMFVREIYKAEKGQVLQPFRMGDQYIVAAVTDVKEEGTQDAATARAIVEPVLRNKKKAELISKKLGTISSLEAVAAAEGLEVEVADSIRLSGSNNSVLGYENKVIGAAFASANKGKLVAQPIPGQSGVYVVRVDDISATPVDNANIESQRSAIRSMGMQRAMYFSPTSVLRKAAKIKDDRAKFY
jgi:peptidyl-prolyl cis-trans isomerase D